MRKKNKHNNVAKAMSSVDAVIPNPITEELEPLPAIQKSSDAAEPTNESMLVDNAELAIRRGGENFYETYNMYKKLRDLAKPMHGKPSSTPIPRPLVIKKIIIEYSVAGDEHRTVEIPEPQKIADIAPLISFAMRDIVERMNNQLHILSYLVSGMHTAVQNAFNARAMAPPPDTGDNTNTQQ